MAIVRNILVRVGADTTQMQRGLQQAQTRIQQFGSRISNLGLAAASIVPTIAISSIKNLGKEYIDAYNQVNNATLGLKTIIEGQGKDFAQANSFIKKYIADGLVPLSDATLAYKNLLSRGYDDSAIQMIMNRFKDAASFNKQAALTMGEAIAGATEGLKNENSILVDNVGVTKNISVMWAEYAKKIGVGVQSLTQAQKMQAEVNGIMKETQYQVGNADKYVATLSGTISKFNTELMYTKAAIGGVLAPALELMLVPLSNGAKAVKNVAEALNKLSPTVKYTIGGVIAGFAAFAVAAAIVIPIVVTLTMVVSMLEVSLLPLLGVLAAVAAAFVIVGAVLGYSFGKDKIAGVVNAIKSIGTTATKASTAQTDLGDSVKDAGDKAKKSLASFDEINQLQDQMANAGTDTGADTGSTGTGVTTPNIDISDFGNSNITKGISDFVQMLKDKFGPTLESIGKSLSSLWEKFKPFLEPVKDFIFDRMKSAGEGLLDILKGLSEVLDGFLKILDGITSGDFSKVLDGIATSLQGVWDVWKGAIKITFPDFAKMLEGVENSIKSSWENYKKNNPDTYNLGGWIKSLWDNSAIGNWVNTAWDNLVGTLQTIWNNFKSKFAAGSGNSIFNIAEWIKYLWDSSGIGDWITTAWDNFVTTLKGLWESFKSLFSSTSSNSIFNIANWIKYLWNSSGISNWITTAWDNFVGTLKNLWASFKSKFAASSGNSVFNIANWIKYLWESSGVSNWISSAWNNFVLNLQNIWNNFKASHPTLFNIAGWFQEMWEHNGKPYLNSIIDDVNKLIALLNKFQINIPKINLPGIGQIGGNTLGFNVGAIPHLATGGVVTQPTIAQIGESGTEAVVPLENTSFIDTFSSAIGSAVMNALKFSGGSNSQQSGDVILSIDGVQFARAIMPGMQKEQSRIGNKVIIQSA